MRVAKKIVHATNYRQSERFFVNKNIRPIFIYDLHFVSINAHQSLKLPIREEISFYSCFHGAFYGSNIFISKRLTKRSHNHPSNMS